MATLRYILILICFPEANREGFSIDGEGVSSEGVSNKGGSQ